MKDSLRCDWALVWTTLLLVLVGMLTVYTASVYFAENNYGASHVFLKRNALRAGFGLVAMAFAYMIDYRSYRRHAKKAILLTLGLLVATLLFGRTVRGMRGFLLMFQPSEVAKLVLVLYLADVLARRRDELTSFVRGLLPRLGLVAGVVILVLLQPDFGSAIAIVVLSLVLLFLGGARLRHIAALSAAALPGVWLAVRVMPHIAERWSVWRATFDLSLQGVDTRGAGYQIFQSLVALGSGGLWGVGIGQSYQRAFIPDPYTDFAFSIWGEEVGFLGTFGLVCVFVFFLIRGLRVARRAPDDYGQILAAGLTGMITIYAVINIAVATALIPTTGLPLPFISYGGSSLVINMIAMGILLNMSRRSSLAASSRIPSIDLSKRWSAGA
ncbi:MAG: cell division protein FtsW, partial [Candidatus Eisenbacteria bacterium]|nr:cell division protein FtsW [Candidatus Eisenbacteria bacterium]